MTKPRVSFSRKLSWFSGGTVHQQARPITPEFSDQQVMDEVQEEVVKQFEAARAGDRLTLDLRRRWRAIGKAIAKRMAVMISASAPKLRPDGRPTGGSLAKEVTRNVKVRRSWFSVSNSRKAGAKVVAQGVKALELQLRELAVLTLRRTKDGDVLVHELEELRDRARELERAGRGAA